MIPLSFTSLPISNLSSSSADLPSDSSEICVYVPMPNITPREVSPISYLDCRKSTPSHRIIKERLLQIKDLEDMVRSDLCVSCEWLKRRLNPPLSTVGRGAVTNWQDLPLGVWCQWWLLPSVMKGTITGT